MTFNQEQVSEPGKIITFYSYKGGTGRSMALANVACLLAQRAKKKKGILIVDWDLEAPGLHRFFRDRLSKVFGADSETDAKLDAHPGLIDIFYNLYDRVRSFDSELEEPNKEIEDVLRKAANLNELILETDIPSLHLLKAGRFDDEYSARINGFPWVDLYDNYAWLFPLFADWLAENYQYVLIDSRTGDTDISSVSSVIMPEKLVTVFTPNSQSLIGVIRVLKRAFRYRKRSEDVRPLMVYPLPSRIDPEEPERREFWRYGNQSLGIPGYQPEFEKLFTEVYGLSECNLDEYFNEVQIQHTSRYAYGEEIAVLIERSRDRLSLSAAFEGFTKRLINQLDPWEDEARIQAQAESDLVANRAEIVFTELNPADQRLMREVLTRVVRLPAPDEGGKPTALRISAEEFSPPAQKLLDPLIQARVLTKEEGLISVENEELITHWRRLKTWLEEDRDFFLWRQQLRSAMNNWVNSARKNRHLLRDEQLSKAKEELASHRQGFSLIENEFIQASNNRAKLVRRIGLIVMSVFILIGSITGILAYQQFEAYQAKRDLAQWGLPSDLYEYQYQLKSLGISSKQITNTAWIKGNLIELDLSSEGLREIDTLPASITQLRLSGTNLTSLQGIEKLTNLTSLTLYCPKLTSLAEIEKLTNLTTLELTCEELTSSAGIEKLTNLTTLNLSGSKLTDLTGIEKLPNLTTLNLGGIRLTDFTEIEKLTNLTSLTLSSAQVTSLARIEKLTNLTSLSLDQLNLHSLAGIEKLTNLITLDLNGLGTTNLPGIESLPNLTTLNLGYMKFTDLSRIEKLTNLTTLNLAYTMLTDFTGIEKLTNLTNLTLNGAGVTSLARLEKLTNLTSLTLVRLNLHSLAGIEKLTNLTSLSLGSSAATNLTGIEKLTNLTKLELLGVGFTNITGIEKLTNLTTLYLNGIRLTDLTGIEKLTNLTSLSLDLLNLPDLARIEKLTNLTSLTLGSSMVTNITGIEKLTNLTTLNLYSTGVTSLEELEKCPKLTTLMIRTPNLMSLKGLPKSLEKLTLRYGL